MKRVLLTVTGKDRAGIIAGVTGCLYRQGCNLEDVSMTILEGQFAMMMMACIQKAKDQDKLRRQIESFARARGLSVYWKDMVKGRETRPPKHVRNSMTYLVRVAGPDRTGIVHKVSRILAGNGLNITDLESRIMGREPRVLYVLVLEVDVPEKFRIEAVERKLAVLAKQLGIEIQIKPMENLSI